MGNIAENEGKWYVIHTYSGYENKVLDSINKMVENMGLQDYIFEVKIPVEEVMEVKNERRRVVQHKLFPSYVMIKMIMTKQTLYLIRNTRGVTGFVGPGSKVPIPLTNEEVRRMGMWILFPVLWKIFRVWYRRWTRFTRRYACSFLFLTVIRRWNWILYR